jgi:MoxR-like ATPase
MPIDQKIVEQLKGKRTLNDIRDLIHCALQIGYTEKLPMLLLSNPGYGKTTIFENWEKWRGRHLVTLIGTQRTREDVLGYQVNNPIYGTDASGNQVVTGHKLVHMNPDWYNEIIENEEKGIHCDLFLDEISQAPEDVQGALLQVCFARKIGGSNNYLPESTMIISAANYKENLPPQCTLQAAMLNRFCLVNIDPVDGHYLVDEFLQDPDDLAKDLVQFEDIKISDKIKGTIRENLKSMYKTLFTSYATKSGDGSQLDIHNQSFNEIFDQPGPVYNFISGRTIGFSEKLATGLIRNGLYHRRFAHIVQRLFLGLVGAGTNTFSKPEDLRDYQTLSTAYFMKVLKKALEASTMISNSVKLDYKNKTVDEAVQAFMLSANGAEVGFDQNFESLITKIHDKYGADVTNMGIVIGKMKDKKDEQLQFVKDINAIQKLSAIIENTDIQQIKESGEELDVIAAAWDGYKRGIEKEVLGI